MNFREYAITAQAAKLPVLADQVCQYLPYVDYSTAQFQLRAGQEKYQWELGTMLELLGLVK